MPDLTCDGMIYYTDKFHPDLGFVPLECENIAKGMYLINPKGEIFSILKNRIMKQDTNWGGYKRVCLITDTGEKRNFSVHRLVALTFIINQFPESYNDVNHSDGKKFNNYYDNLEWCNNNQNKHHASETGLYERGEDRYNAVYTDAFTNEVCEKFQQGIPYEEVYRYYQSIYPNTGSTVGSFIYKLYHRKTRRHITDLYVY